MIRPSFPTSLVAGITMLLASACATDSVPPREIDASAAVDQVFQDMRDRSNGGVSSGFTYATTLPEFLPNQLIAFDDAPAKQLSDGVVVGDIIDARVEYAGVIAQGADGEELPAGQEVPGDATDADWRELSVTMVVTDGWGAGIEPGDEITFMIPDTSETPIEVTIAGLEAMDSAIAVLDDAGSVTWNDNLSRLAMNQSALGVVDATGTISFPGMHSTNAQAFLSGLTTLAKVDAAVDGKRTIVHVREGRRVTPRP